MESNIDILRPDGSLLVNVTFATNSYRRFQVMGEHAVTLNFDYPGFLEIPVGSYVNFKGYRYTLYNPSDFTKNGNRQYAYTLKLQAYQALLDDSLFINEPDGRTSFSRQARPQEFLQAVVDNMNREDAGWMAGAVIDTNVQQNIQFNETTCSEALKLIAEAFKTEWEVVDKVISLRKVEKFKDAPLKMSYGGGQTRDVDHGGFKPGLGRGNFDGSRPTHRLYVRGGDRNIEFSTYGSQTLIMPSGQTIRFDGTYFEDQPGYNSRMAREYLVSDDGRSITRTDGKQVSKREGSVDLTNIYPMREGTITRVLWIYAGTEYDTYQEALDAAIAAESDAGSVFCDVFDHTIPVDLDYSQWRLDGEQMIFTLQTGRFAGRDIGIEQDEDRVGYIHVDPSDPSKNRRFRLITEAEYGSYIPDSRISVGDRYAVFGMKMPDAYIRNDATKSGGSWELLREAVRYKYENEELRFTFKGEMDGIWAQNNWDAIEDKIVPGGYVLFSDPQFQPSGVLIRIAAIKEYLHTPYKPKLELTNIVIGGGLRGELAQIPKQEVIIDEGQRDIAMLNNRRWRDTMELRNRLSDLHLNFTEAINPVSVNTMQLIAGDPSLQFRFVDNKTTPSEVRPSVVYDDDTKTLKIYQDFADKAPILQHLTLGISEMKHTHTIGEYRFWTISSYNGTEPLESDKLYWVYARVPRTGNGDGTFVVTQQAVDMEGEAGWYHLLVGALNSEYEGERSYSSLYGFTEVLPGQVLTPMIRSNDGSTFFDLVQGIIGGRITFIGSDGNSKYVSQVDDEQRPKDRTQTVIDGGLITTGTLAVGGGGSASQSNAGISGNDPTNPGAIRLWSGSPVRQSAPFRVTHSGKLFASGAEISGLIKSSSSGGRIEINPDQQEVVLITDAGRKIFRLFFRDGVTGEYAQIRMEGNCQLAGGELQLFPTTSGGALHAYGWGGIELGDFRVTVGGTSTSVILRNLPTTAIGLGANQVWRDGDGYLRIT